VIRRAWSPRSSRSSNAKHADAGPRYDGRDAKRRARRGSRPGTGAFALARRFTLAPITTGEVGGGVSDRAGPGWPPDAGDACRR
jgi:hypothetical protein